MPIPNLAPPALDPAQHGIFLDIDGTVVELAPRPDDVTGDDELRAALRSLGERHNGALAVITGRSIADADRILGGAVPFVAGVHGLERRVGERVVRLSAPEGADGALRRKVLALATAFQALVEEKAGGFALHYRLHPQFGDLVRRAVDELAVTHGMRTVHGKMVAELLPPGPNKGHALSTLMGEARFAGRVPVAVGDDTTDEDAFAAAAALGGFAVLVGPRRESNAAYHLESVADVRKWLAGAAP